MNVALRFEGVSLSYCLPAKTWKQRLGWKPRERLSAFRSLDLAVAAGQSVGLVGSNGAGKSTLLRLAAGILTPQSGKVQVRGRVRALLELGAGFDPARTARENAHFLASMLQLPEGLLQRNWGNIRDQVGADLNRVLRTYSQGMVLKLAFAVSTLDAPELLLVDESFLVGDACFRGRALDRVRELKKQGTAVVFAGHDFEVMRLLCDRAVWLEKGTVRADGSPEEVFDAYLEATAKPSAANHLTGLSFQAEGQEALQTGGAVQVAVALDGKESGFSGRISVNISSSTGTRLASQSAPVALQAGSQVVYLRIGKLPLEPGEYRLEAALQTAQGVSLEEFGRGVRMRVHGLRQSAGPLALAGTWSKKTSRTKEEPCRKIA